MAVFDPRNVIYAGGAKCDGQYVLDAVIAAGTNVVNSASGRFTSGHVGKTIWVTDSHGVNLDQTTISGYTSPTQVTTAGVARGAATGLPSFGAWGTDDTAAYVAAYAAAVSLSTQNTILVPGPVNPNGGSIISGRIFNCLSGIPPAMIGEAGPFSVLLVSPNLPIPGDGSAPLIRTEVGSGMFKDITAFGPTAMYALLPNQAIMKLNGANASTLENIQLLQFGATDPTTQMLAIRASNRLVLRRPSAYQAAFATNVGPAVGSQMTGMLFDNARGNVYDAYASNIWRGIGVTNIVSRDGVGLGGLGGAMLNFRGGHLDECESGSNFTVFNGGEVNVDGMVMWTSSNSGVPSGAAVVDPTSKMWLSNCGLGPYGQGDRGAIYKALIIQAGGEVRSLGGNTFHISSLATNQSVDNQGKFYGNVTDEFKNASAGGNLAGVIVPWRTAFTRPDAVIR